MTASKAAQTGNSRVTKASTGIQTKSKAHAATPARQLQRNCRQERRHIRAAMRKCGQLPPNRAGVRADGWVAELLLAAGGRFRAFGQPHQCSDHHKVAQETGFSARGKQCCLLGYWRAWANQAGVANWPPRLRLQL